MTPDERELLRRAREGDRAALDALLEPQRDRVKNLAAALGGDATSAEDVVQETFRVALVELARYQPDEARLSTWLCGIALNLVRRGLRDQARHAVPTDPGAFDARSTRRGVLTSVIRRELVDRLDDAIARLPTAMREAFVLHHLGGLEFEEVGRLLEVSAGTARVRAHRARTLLRQSLGPALDPGWLEA